MARTKKPRYVKLHTVGTVVTTEGLALEAHDDDGRTVYVVISPIQADALRNHLTRLATFGWFQDLLEQQWTRLRAAWSAAR